ncbi:hypothetical protein M885DRAFT_279579 [Pelagophyceae sp. CCMP2097]|nr:hypothetical protein M885DRAFT_279579 [Pelagophyceae sp. CCMP2097]|mmetsp:Transcript_1943/g.5828  ORF Transcript_1943/g.5828 Transcript_1943/m.5828 type:complete len:317 (+) Transcript_1943:460-1410(+)
MRSNHLKTAARANWTRRKSRESSPQSSAPSSQPLANSHRLPARRWRASPSEPLPTSRSTSSPAAARCRLTNLASGTIVQGSNQRRGWNCSTSRNGPRRPPPKTTTKTTSTMKASTTKRTTKKKTTTTTTTLWRTSPLTSRTLPAGRGRATPRPSWPLTWRRRTTASSTTTARRRPGPECSVRRFRRSASRESAQWSSCRASPSATRPCSARRCGAPRGLRGASTCLRLRTSCPRCATSTSAKPQANPATPPPRLGNCCATSTPPSPRAMLASAPTHPSLPRAWRCSAQGASLPSSPWRGKSSQTLLRRRTRGATPA